MQAMYHRGYITTGSSVKRFISFSFFKPIPLKDLNFQQSSARVSGIPVFADHPQTSRETPN